MAGKLNTAVESEDEIKTFEKRFLQRVAAKLHTLCVSVNISFASIFSFFIKDASG